MTRIEFRPLAAWPWPSTPQSKRRGPGTFTAGGEDTLAKLTYELERLKAGDVIVQTFLRPQDIRRDGMPRANVPHPSHPGVAVTATTKAGALVWRTDVCVDWQHNIRSIALGLEALRAVDRHGITSTGEQYAGFRQIEARSMPAGGDPIAVLVNASGWSEQAVRNNLTGAYRAAAKQHHPDSGGDPAAWLSIDGAWRSLRCGT